MFKPTVSAMIRELAEIHKGGAATSSKLVSFGDAVAAALATQPATSQEGEGIANALTGSTDQGPFTKFDDSFYAATPTPPTPPCPCDPDNFANPDEHDISCVHAVPDSAPHLRREVLPEEIIQADRDQAASFIPTYAGWNGRMFADRVRSGKCDEHELVKAFAQHRLNSLAATPTPPTLSEDLRGLIEAILLYADPSGDGLYDGANDIAGTKQSGELVLKGSFITTCIRLRAALAQVKAS